MRELRVAFMYEMSIRRSCRNPFEKHEVVGITNYVTLGAEVVTPLDATAAADNTPFRLAAAWQINKNWMVKARITNTDVAASVAVKTWADPSITLAVAQHLDFATRRVRTGLNFEAENFGRIIYGRADKSRALSTVLREHEATEAERTDHDGRVFVVDDESFEAADDQEFDSKLPGRPAGGGR